MMCDSILLVAGRIYEASPRIVMTQIAVVRSGIKWKEQKAFN